MKLCDFDTCENTALAKRLCSGHYYQQYKGKELTPLLASRRPPHNDLTNEAWCSACKQYQPDEEFGWNKTRGERKGLCKKAHAMRNSKPEYVNRAREHYRANRSEITARKYGLTTDQYDTMFSEQSVCYLCGGVSGRGLVVDHNHETGKVRGVLCDNCNKGLGHFRDNAELLRKAADYLDAQGYWQKTLHP